MKAKVIIGLLCGLFLLSGLLLASDTRAGMFPDLDAKMVAAKARDQAINQRRAQEMKNICDRYAAEKEELDLARRVEVQAAAVTKPVAETNCKWMAPFKMTVLLPFTTAYAAFKGLTSPSSSPLEFLLVPSFCRAFNTAKSHVIQTEIGGFMDICTLPFNETGYAPQIGKVGLLSKRAMRRYPLTQACEAAAFWVPVSLTAFAALDGIQGVSQSGAIAIEGVSGGTVGIGLAEGLNYLEVKATDAVFNK